MDNPDHEHHYWLSRHMVSPLVGDFFETVTREITGAKIIANNNGETSRFGAADLIKGKTIIETKATAEVRNDFTFSSNQLKDYDMFYKAGYDVEYYLWEYDKPRDLRLTKFRTEEQLFEFLAGSVLRLIITDHKTIWPLFLSEQIEGIWFNERDYVRLYKKIIRPLFVLKGEHQTKLNGFTLEYKSYGLAGSKNMDRRQHRQKSRNNRRVGVPHPAP
jgi:hypothetical protein